MTEASTIQSHSDLPAPSKNPYAQRRSTTESLIQTSTQHNLLVDATNVAAKSLVLPPKLPGTYADRDNDYDDDEMIDDYMEYDNDKPPDEYEPYIDDEFEVVETSEQTIEHDLATTSTHTAPPSVRTVPIFREEHDENFNDVDMLRQHVPTQSRPKKDLYTFERYGCNTLFINFFRCLIRTHDMSMFFCPSYTDLSIIDNGGLRKWHHQCGPKNGS